MSSENNISISRTLVSMPSDFTEKMKKHAEKKDIPLSSIIRSALKVYTNDENECFIELVNQFAGARATKRASEMIEKHQIPQDELLEHVLKEASAVLCQLKDGQSFEEIRCVLPPVEKHNPSPEDEQLKKDVAEIEAQIDQEIRLRKKAG